MGYGDEYKAYRLVDINNNKVYISRDVIFSEEICEKVQDNGGEKEFE